MKERERQREREAERERVRERERGREREREREREGERERGGEFSGYSNQAQLCGRLTTWYLKKPQPVYGPNASVFLAEWSPKVSTSCFCEVKL